MITVLTSPAYLFELGRYLPLLLLIGIVPVCTSAAQSSRAGTGEVISVREFPLKPGVQPVEFEKFVVETFNPGLEGAMPGVKAFVTKADRGVGNGRYAYVIIFDTQKTRDAMIPAPDKVAEWFTELFYGPAKPLYEELWQYADRTAWSGYTDYVVLR